MNTRRFNKLLSLLHINQEETKDCHGSEYTVYTVTNQYFTRNRRISVIFWNDTNKWYISHDDLGSTFDTREEVFKELFDRYKISY